MEQNKTHSALLECIKDSAFLVKDGIVTQVNEAAQKHLIRPGADLDMLLESGEDEYNTFTQGCLCLTVTIFGASYRASVIKSGDCDLFILHGESDTQIEAALNAYALAAMNLRGPMSKLSLALEKILPLVSQLENEELAESIGRLNQGFYQLHRIIANMADAKEYSNGFAPNLEQTNVTSLVADIFEQVCSLLQSAQYHLQLTNLSKPLFCLVDRGILQRAIYNMIANALKFSDPQDSIQVTLRHTGSRLYLTVQNQNKYPRNFYGD